MDVELLPAWRALLQIRQLTRVDAAALEWDGEYIHFRHLYADMFHQVDLGRAIPWGIFLPDNIIVGQLFVQLESQRRELADGRDFAYIHGFRIRSEYRGHGLGSQLISHVESDLSARNFKWITLNVAKNNQSGIRFYRQHGFFVVGADPGQWSYLDHQGIRQFVHEPAWRMHKKLS